MEDSMAKQTTKMICSKCGTEMNHHADKLVHPVTAEEARKVNPALEGIIEETHCCPGCGAVESRRAS
jgi:exosome complex RNA-binding protein Csl4